MLRSPVVDTWTSSDRSRGSGPPHSRAAVVWLNHWSDRRTAATASTTEHSTPASTRTPWIGATRSLRRSRGRVSPSRRASPTRNGTGPNGSGSGVGFTMHHIVRRRFCRAHAATQPVENGPSRASCVVKSAEPTGRDAPHVVRPPGRTRRRTGTSVTYFARSRSDGRRAAGDRRQATGTSSPPHAERPPHAQRARALLTGRTRSPCRPWGRRPAWPGPSRACRRRRPRS